MVVESVGIEIISRKTYEQKSQIDSSRHNTAVAMFDLACIMLLNI